MSVPATVIPVRSLPNPSISNENVVALTLPVNEPVNEPVALVASIVLRYEVPLTCKLRQFFVGEPRSNELLTSGRIEELTSARNLTNQRKWKNSTKSWMKKTLI